MKSISVTLFIISILSCKTYKPNYILNDNKVLPMDYNNMDNWAAHPNKIDESDLTPEGDTLSYKDKSADVFFIHPTTYTGEKNQDQWNGDIQDRKLNKKTDEGTIRFQASAFNYAGRVFAPRYRQAHLHAYFTKDKDSASKAFELAYEDVKAAFEYYLTFENKGRPIVIASHSQGTNHAERLLQDFFTGKPLRNQLVAAYLLGMPVRKNQYSDILPCKDSSDTVCFISWRTFKKGHYLPARISSDDIAVTNPLTWTTDDTYAPKSLNKGTLLFDFNKVYPTLVDAQVSKDILWATKPKFRGSILLRTKNYHVADINFYYFNIRENAKHRVDVFMLKN